MTESDGTVTGLKVRLVDDMGATAEAWGTISCAKPVTSFTGCYAIPTAQYDLTIVATNKLPQAPYRGMGPPPHNLVLEQLMDIAAADLGMDPGEIRRLNFIPSDAFPYTIASGNEYDSGDYEACLDAVLEMGEYKELRRRQTEARDEGRLVGLGLVSTIEPGVFDWNAYAIVGVQGTGVPEGATVSMDIFGKISCRVGFGLEGQGQYTLIAQILADYFGTEMDDIRVIPLDTLSAPPNFGPGGSRLGVAISGAVLGAAELLKEKLLRVAAVLLQTEASNLELAEATIRIPGVEAAVLQTIRDALDAFVELGAEVVEVTVPASYQVLVQGWGITCAVECARAHQAYYPARKSEYGEVLAGLIDLGINASQSDYDALEDIRCQFRTEFDAVLERIDLFIVPCMPVPTPTVEEMDVAVASPDGRADIITFTAPFDYSGHPTITLPAGLADTGLPASFQLVGRTLGEATLIHAGSAYEQARGFHAHPID